METTPTCIASVKLEPVDPAPDLDCLLYDQSTSHALVSVRRTQRRSALSLEGQSCSTLYARRLTSHRSHRPRPPCFAMSRAPSSAVAPRVKREVVEAPLGPPKEHQPGFDDALHTFWMGEIVGDPVREDECVLRMTTWMNAMDLICERAGEVKMRLLIRPGNNQQLVTKCKCPQHLAKLREIAEDWLSRGNKTRTKVNGQPKALIKETEFHPIIAQLCKWYLWRSEFTTLADHEARTAAFYQRAKPRLKDAFPSYINDRWRDRTVVIKPSPYFSPARELEAAGGAGPVLARTNSASSATTAVHPYASAAASRSALVKTEPSNDEAQAEARYRRAEPYLLTMPHIKREEDS
ncbi:unnamed protein product [Peniophora sp. CBMAI 1063]|nr:unnamed protein product [Peniophora sp. CBMAI 1063]